MVNKKLSIIFMILITILWNPTFELTRQLLCKLGPMTIIFIRFLLGSIIVYLLKMIFKVREKIDKKDYKLLLMVSVFGLLHYLLSNISNINLNSTELMAFSSFQAIITLIFASLLLNIVITPTMSFCVGISSVGAVLTINVSQMYNSIGYIFMSLAMLFWVLYCILIINLLLKYNIITIIFYQTIITVLILIPALFFEDNNISLLNSNDIYNLCFLGVFGIGICFVLNAYSLKHIGPIAVSVFMNIGPIMINSIKMIGSSHETLDILTIVGIAMIYIGTFVVFYNIWKSEKYS